jgi:cytosine/adenosine deaminase-related metal-dependent hydrolase
VTTLLHNAYVVVMDDAVTEHETGWVLLADDLVAEVGNGPQPEADERIDLGGALVTPGLVNTHHHLYQTLTRAQAQQADLFTWLKTLYPIWARLDGEAEYAAARTGLAELMLSGCTTAFDHHYVFPKGQPDVIDALLQAASDVGAHLVVGRGSMDLGESKGGLPPDDLVEDREAILEETERLIERGVEVAVSPCSPFSVTRELMIESAELARKHGVPLHTHLAETVEEEAYCQELYGCTPSRWAGSRTTSGARTASTSPTTTFAGSASSASASPTARRPTSGSAPALRRCVNSLMPEPLSASASTVRRRTSAATSSSRSSRLCSWPEAVTGRWR